MPEGQSLRGSCVAVTGATGFIGRYLVHELLSRGAKVIGAVRSPDKVPSLIAQGVEMRRADLADVDALTRAFDGCDAVIANAGVVSIGRKSRAELMAANARGTQNVFTAIARAGVGRAVMTSSVSVYRRQRRAYVESDPLIAADARVPRPLYYAQSKAVAEREAWRVAAENDIELSVARPGGVYGAFDRTGFTSWLRRIMRVPLLSVFPTHLRIPNVYAEDLARAMVNMLEVSKSVGRAYNLTGDPDLTFWQMQRAYRDAGGQAPPLVLPIPIPLRFCYSNQRAIEDLGFKNRAPKAAFEHMLQLEADERG